MGKKSSAPPPPDYTPIADASMQAAQLQAQTAQQQLAWAQTQAAQNARQNRQVLNFDKSVANQELAMQQQDQQWATQDRNTYEQNYAPLEKQYASTAAGWDSAARENQQAGEAAATTANQYNAAKQANIDQLEAYGIDPSQTRFASLNLASDLSGAAASAGAANIARQNTQLQGAQMLQNAVAMGRGEQTQALQDTGSSVSAGNSAASNTNQGLSNSLATTASAASTEGTAPQWNTLSNQSLGTWGNTLNMGYQNQLGQFEANQQASSGIGALLGMTAGMGLGSFAGGTNSIYNGIKTMFAANGGAVPMGYASGGDVTDTMPLDGRAGALPVPSSASPSGGQAVDDVNARLTAGEYIVPRDAALWLGEEKLNKLVEKTRQDRVRAAQPQGAPHQGAMPPQAIPMQHRGPVPSQGAGRAALPV